MSQCAPKPYNWTKWSSAIINVIIYTFSSQARESHFYQTVSGLHVSDFLNSHLKPLFIISRLYIKDPEVVGRAAASCQSVTTRPSMCERWCWILNQALTASVACWAARRGSMIVCHWFSSSVCLNTSGPSSPLCPAARSQPTQTRSIQRFTTVEISHEHSVCVH